MNEAEAGIPGPNAAEIAAAEGSSRAGPISAAPSPSSLGYPLDHRDEFEDEFRHVQHVGVFYGLLLLPILVATGWSFHTGSDAIEIEFWGGSVFYIVIAIFAIIWRCDWFHLLRLPSRVDRRWVFLTLATPLVTIGAALLLRFWGLSIGLPVEDVAESFAANGYPVWVLALSVIVLAPVFEEIAFRGLMLEKLQKVMRPPQAIWVAATLFGVIHFSVLSMAVFLVPLAVAAGFLTRETKSLLPAIGMHAAHNAGIVFLSLLGI